MSAGVEDVAALARSPAPAAYARPTPHYCVWELTLQCDLGCRHCGSRAGAARPSELSTAQCLDVVRQLADLGVKEVTLIGGEAYLREDWDVIAAAIVARGMLCSMTTGARDLSAERVRRAVDAGVRAISISLDGLRRTHDALRGAKGSWAAAVEAAGRVADSGIRLSVNTQINRLSGPELPALADLLVALRCKAWQIQMTVPMGRAADRPALLLQPFELLDLFPLLVWIKQTKLDPNGVRLFPGNNVGYFGPYEALLRYGGKDGAHWAGCSAGSWSIGLEADGKIKGCPSLPSDQYTGGYIQDVSIAHAVETAPEINAIKQRTRESLWGFCAGCRYASVCRAGCTWTSTVFFGRSGNNPYCIHRALERERAGLRERVVKVGMAPGRPFNHGRFEARTEPAATADDEAPTILGHAVDRVLGLRHTDDSFWHKREIVAVLGADVVGE